MNGDKKISLLMFLKSVSAMIHKSGVDNYVSLNNQEKLEIYRKFGNILSDHYDYNYKERSQTIRSDEDDFAATIRLTDNDLQVSVEYQSKIADYLDDAIKLIKSVPAEGKIRYELNGFIEDFGILYTKLCRASHSIYSSTVSSTRYRSRYITELDDMPLIFTEDFVTSGLALNVVRNRLTGNSVGWNNCGIEISANGVDYETSGGTEFGWDVYPDDDNYTVPLTVYCMANAEGTLERSLKKHGFVFVKSKN